MTVRMKVAAVVGATSVVLALPVAAQAKSITKTVDLGLPTKSQATFQKAGGDVDDFFPHGTTIHVGDKVRFVPTGFHTLDLPAKGKGPLALIAPTGTTVSGPTGVDAAGNPFWFDNTVQNVGFNPLLLKGTFGKRFTYRGKSRIESGLPLAPRPKPITVKFTRKGTYTFFCDIHPGMRGVVRVRAKNRRIPSKKADRRALKKQLARALKTAKALPASAKVPANTVSVGLSGKGGVEIFAFVPQSLTVPVGTTVTFAMPLGTRETHTATTGPGDPGATDPAQAGYLGALAASFNAPVIDPRAAYPSEAPGTVGKLTPTLHGNGFWNSGGMDGASVTTLPNASQVTFSQAGTYTFYCLIHPFMKATVIAQ